MKILFTSIGRRVELVEAFKNASKKLNVDLIIVGADISETAPAMFFCDEKIIVPKIKSEDYIPTLLNICEKKRINCLIPTIDTDLLILAKNKSRFEKVGTKVLVASAEKVALCRDKKLTANYFNSLGLRSPEPVNDINLYNCGFPAFIKPKDGSSSINAFKINGIEELKTYSKNIEDYIIQPFIEGKEFTIDIFCDYQGNVVFITPRERVAVRAGEVLKTRIHQDDIMIDEMKKLVEDFKPSGQITVQLIQDKNTGKNYYIEINPRFGGGAPLSIKAGADSAMAILMMLSGKSLSYVPYAARDNEIYSRFDQSVCVQAGKQK